MAKKFGKTAASDSFEASQIYIYIPAPSCGCQIIAFTGKIGFGYWRMFPGEQRQFLCLLKWWAYDGVPDLIHAQSKALRSSKLVGNAASHNQNLPQPCNPSSIL
jgi:hypothetical protein